MKNFLMTLAITLLIGIVITVLFLSVLIVIEGFYQLNNNKLITGVVDIAPFLSAIVVSSGVLIAILAFIRDREKLSREKEENRSKLFFEQPKAGLDEVEIRDAPQNVNPHESHY